MRFSQQVQYAIAGVFDLAYNGLGDSVQVRVIGARQAIPTRYLEQIFQRLRRAHLVRGKRGPGGGYVLARTPREISVLEIIQAVEGPGDAGDEPGRSEAEQETPVTGRPHFLAPWLLEHVEGALAAISVEDICRHAAREGVERIGFAGPDYQI